jgi:hypothetical protein
MHGRIRFPAVLGSRRKWKTDGGHAPDGDTNFLYD